MELNKFEEKINHFFLKNNIVPQNKNFLLAVSGGVDSMVLLHIFQKLKYNISVAHVNFGLRGEDSNNDFFLVKEKCKALKIPFYYKEIEDFYTIKNYKKVSTQMIARKLRYDWFEEIVLENRIDYILTAHHQGDQIETFFLNIQRKKGIQSHYAIKSVNKNRLRPFLDIPKEEIISFANENNIEWREDATNKKSVYLRNKIRNKLLPSVGEIKNLKEGIFDIQQKMKLYADFFNKYYETSFQKHIIKTQNNTLEIDIEKLKNDNLAFEYFQIWLSEKGFFKQIVNILDSMKSQETKIFESSQFEITIERNKILFESKENKVSSVNIAPIIVKEDMIPFNFREWRIEKIEFKDTLEIKKDKSILYMDFDKIKFPITIRNINEGDKIMPFGVNFHKKITKYLRDIKVALNTKKNTFILKDQDNIICIFGREISQKVKITNSTKSILVCHKN